jgi:hypothetical protein
MDDWRRFGPPLRAGGRFRAGIPTVSGRPRGQHFELMRWPRRSVLRTEPSLQPKARARLDRWRSRKPPDRGITAAAMQAGITVVSLEDRTEPGSTHIVSPECSGVEYPALPTLLNWQTRQLTPAAATIEPAHPSPAPPRNSEPLRSQHAAGSKWKAPRPSPKRGSGAESLLRARLRAQIRAKPFRCQA